MWASNFSIRKFVWELQFDRGVGGCWLSQLSVARFFDKSYNPCMAINSSFLGATTVSGDEAKAFSRMVSHGRTSKNVTQAAENGRKMAVKFAKTGVVSFKLKASAKQAA